MEKKIFYRAKTMEEFDKDDYIDKFSDYYMYIKTIGSGSFGKVVEAVDRYTNEILAVKIIKKHTVKQGKINELKKEAKILSSLDHPNITKFKHLKETETRIFIGMEIIYGGTLKELMQNREILETDAIKIMKSVLLAVHYMHSNNVVHRDIKPENILASDINDLSKIKVSDFGLSAQYESHIMMSKHENCGTLLFMAHEQVSNHYYSNAVDIWSCAILLFMLLTRGSHPMAYPGEKYNSYLEKLKKPVWKFPANFPKKAKNLIRRMTKLNPLDRYTASQALRHPWINQQELVAPLTSFEKFKIYLEELKFKSIVYAVLFASIVKPADTKPIEKPAVQSTRVQNTNLLEPDSPALLLKCRSQSSERHDSVKQFSSSFISLTPDSQAYLKNFIKLDVSPSKKTKKKPALPKIRGVTRAVNRSPYLRNMNRSFM